MKRYSYIGPVQVELYVVLEGNEKEEEESMSKMKTGEAR